MKTEENTVSHTVNRRKRLGYMYMIPSLVILAVFVIYPVIYGAVTSLYDWDWVAGIDKKLFVGLGNYLQIFSDRLFWNALKNTVIFAVLSLLAEFVLGLCCAMLLYKIKKGGVIFRTVLIFPLTISDMVAAIMWRMMLDPASGVVNQMLRSIGLKPVDWLGNANIVIFTLVLVEVWWMTGNITLIMLAGLQSMPIDQLECGQIDGANSWQRFRYLQWPHLRSFAESALSLRMIDLLRVFAIAWAVTQGGPNRASEVSQQYIYTNGLGGYLDIGYSIAMAILFSVFVVAIVAVIKRIIRIGGDNE